MEGVHENFEKKARNDCITLRLHMLLRCAGVLVKTWLAMHTIEVVEGDETNDSLHPLCRSLQRLCVCL